MRRAVSLLLAVLAMLVPAASAIAAPMRDAARVKLGAENRVKAILPSGVVEAEGHTLFLQRDPNGYQDSVNQYAYGANDPINHRDPTGRFIPALVACAANPICRAAVGAGVGAVVGAAFDAAHQAAEIYDDPSRSFSLSRVGSAAVAGAGVGGLAAVNPTLGAGIAAGSAALSGRSAIESVSKGHYATAAVDAAGAVLAGIGARKLGSLPATREPLPPSVEAVLRGASGQSGGGAPFSTTTLYRGVYKGHTKYADALEGRAVPRGGKATPAEHNIGDTDSEYTSWTPYESLARGFALQESIGKYGSGEGVVLRAEVPKSVLISTPDIASEGEVLVEGVVEANQVTRVTRGR